VAAEPDALSRRTALEAHAAETSGCTRCRLAQGRTQVVYGVGDPDADLMFVGEAPGFHEDKQGYPFVGSAGKLLDRLLEGIGLTRRDVYIANVLKCLRYTASVQLGDGSWERIGRLVRSRYDGDVMSVDSEGRLVPRRVTGWYESPLGGRRVFRLTYRSAKRAGGGKVSIELTGDHEVLTEGGFVPVEDLEPGDRIATGQGLSALERDVVCGSLLGDGTLSGKSSHVSFTHSNDQREYALFKAALLVELQPRIHELVVPLAVGGERTYPIVQARTLASRALRILRRDFYRPTKRVPPWMAKELNERMLAIWFMDDGHLRVRSGRQPSAEIAAHCFPSDDLRILQEGLFRLGIPSKASHGRLNFDVAATKTLSERIAPFVPAFMRHKLHPDVAERVPFDNGRFAHGYPEVFFDEAEVEDVTDKPRTDTTFFCIDVEETHNFVTAGGVVHNCRPPGNRDPQPDEIEACESHLFRQLELIQPKLVATLGNFATKLLSGKPTGITRVHGRPQEALVGGRRVTLYPIYHPAAALYTPAMLRTLEEDFARIPELLAGSAGSAAPPAEAQVIDFPTPAVAATHGGPSEEQLGLF
jgi:uracil-DNA glycosylase family 4